MRSGLSIYSSLRQHGHFYTSERQIFIHISLMNYGEIFCTSERRHFSVRKQFLCAYFCNYSAAQGGKMKARKY